MKIPNLLKEDAYHVVYSRVCQLADQVYHFGERVDEYYHRGLSLGL